MSSPAKSPAFQFYPNDWLSSTHIMLMTPAEEGAYIRLLAISWNNENCDLPDDDEQLAVLSRLGEGWFNGGSTKIRKCFKAKGNRLYNERLLEERKKQQEWREKSRQGGIKSGKSRNNKDLTKEGSLKGGSQMVGTKREPNGNSSSSFSSSSSNTKKKTTKVAFVLPEDISPEVWDAFVEHRKILKKPLTDHAKKLLIQKLEKIGQDKNAVLNQAIEKGWQSVFPLKDDNPLFQNQQPTQTENPVDKLKRQMKERGEI